MGKTTRRKNTANLIPHAQLTTAFNPFGKIDCISDEGSGYRTDFTYGPDGERWISVLHQGNTLQRTVYYMGDYEEIVEGGTIRRFYYLDGNVLYKKQTGCPDSVFYLFTDHLGSIVSIVDRNGSEKFSAAYDAWGNQTVTRNDIGFHRGYTGHEMLPEFGLINMNGRLYDPLIGRFLSTDNYVQEPWNSQNFNRYSYSLNNPLKYTDPDGEWFFVSTISGFIRGMVDLVTGNGAWYSPFYQAYKNGANDLKVTWGLFKGSPKQILSRFTWELPQTIIGYTYSSYKLAFHDVDKVRYFDGATYVIDNTNKDDGVTIGSFININTTSNIPENRNGKFAPYLNPLYAHEYGHYIQSHRTGWGYVFSHGIPSLLSAKRNKGKYEYYHHIYLGAHCTFWTEMDANNKAANYFVKKGYLSSWPYLYYPIL